ncbi:MAG: type II secretion system F family protein [Hyphomicrobiaceae bacterium]|nr:type II secretion system F family protein [Hyphomicrobiaceae bacterium]
MVSPETIAAMVPVLVALAAGSAGYVLISLLFNSNAPDEKRLAAVTETRAAKIAVKSTAEQAASRKKQVADTLKELEDRQKKAEKVTLRLRLQRAGLKITPQTFWIVSGFVGAVCGFLVVISTEPTLLNQVGAIVAAFVGMFGLPRWVLGKMTDWRQQKFLAELANALDVVVRGVKSGLPLNECLQIIARESPEPIASEFREVVEQQRIGVTLHDALERMCQRIPVPEVRFLTIVIGIQSQTGGNLSEALGNLAGVLRDRIRMKMKVKALSAEATASAAVLGSLPPGVMTMIYLAAPKYINPLFATKTGNFFIALGLFWMFCGVMVMRKMINFKY